MQGPLCPYCNIEASLVKGDVIYPHRHDLHPLNFWRCGKCVAYCGCHKGTCMPLGVPANEATRRARNAAHARFDPLWRGAERRGKHTRRQWYEWLAEQMGLHVDACHIGLFSEEQCSRVLEICANATQADVAKRR